MNYIDKKITLDDNKKYLVIEQVTIDDKIYLYIVNEDDKNDTSFVEVENDSIKAIDPTLFQEKILPLFLEKLKK